MTNDQDAKAYKRYLKNLRDIASEQHTKMADAQDLINKGREEERFELILEMDKEGLSIAQIARVAKKTERDIVQILDKHKNKH
ncbi:MAG: hypothetical protein ACKV1O_21195 [Saprospiraceae bacterium]